jgi:hypothetical protein
LSHVLICILDLREIFGTCFLYEWYGNDSDFNILCPPDYDVASSSNINSSSSSSSSSNVLVLSHSGLLVYSAVVEIFASMTIEEFSNQTSEKWINICEKEIALYANQHNIDISADDRLELEFYKEPLIRLREKCHNLFTHCNL